MVFKELIRGFIALFHRIDDWSAAGDERVYETKEVGSASSIDEIHSVWDYLHFKPNTQAFHLASSLGFDEWVEMNEIRRRIKEIFGAEYKNERSLYPYLKTLTDVGLVENSSVGGRMRWRKHDLVVKLEKEEGEKKVVVVEARAGKKSRKPGE